MYINGDTALNVVYIKHHRAATATATGSIALCFHRYTFAGCIYLLIIANHDLGR